MKTLLLALIPAVFLTTSIRADLAGSKPNIILVITDD